MADDGGHIKQSAIQIEAPAQIESPSLDVSFDSQPTMEAPILSHFAASRRSRRASVRKAQSRIESSGNDDREPAAVEPPKVETPSKEEFSTSRVTGTQSKSVIGLTRSFQGLNSSSGPEVGSFSTAFQGKPLAPRHIANATESLAFDTSKVGVSGEGFGSVKGGKTTPSTESLGSKLPLPSRRLRPIDWTLLEGEQEEGAGDGMPFGGGGSPSELGGGEPSDDEDEEKGNTSGGEPGGDEGSPKSSQGERE